MILAEFFSDPVQHGLKYLCTNLYNSSFKITWLTVTLSTNNIQSQPQKDIDLRVEQEVLVNVNQLLGKMAAAQPEVAAPLSLLCQQQGIPPPRGCMEALDAASRCKYILYILHFLFTLFRVCVVFYAFP